jgi:hypothetical protein
MTTIAPPRPKPAPVADAPVAKAIIGHNRPPLDVEAVADINEKIDARDGFRKKMADLLASAPRAAAFDEESASRCSALEVQLRAAVKHIDDAHTAAKAPYLEAGRAVDAIKNALRGPLIDAGKAVNALGTKYLNDENAKRQAEYRRQQEVQRQEQQALRDQHIAAQREADAKREAERALNPGDPGPERDVFGLLPIDEPVFVAPIAPPAPLQVRSDFGTVMSGTRVWTGTVVDYDVAYIAVSSNSKVREAIDKAIQSLVKGGLHEIEGVRIASDLQARSR